MIEMDNLYVLKFI